MNLIEIVEQLEKGLYHNETSRLIDDPAFIALKKNAEDAYNIVKAFETIGNILTPEPADFGLKSKWQEKLDKIRDNQKERLKNEDNE